MIISIRKNDRELAATDNSDPSERVTHPRGVKTTTQKGSLDIASEIKTKPRFQPSERQLQESRFKSEAEEEEWNCLERERVETTEKLEANRKAGLGAGHPEMVTLSVMLKSIESSQAKVIARR